MRTRILIVDDDARFRALARALLEGFGYVIAGEAADGAQALAIAARVSPDAALLDVQLPDIDGLTLARRLLQTDGRLRIVLTSTDPTLVARNALAQSGAVAFVPKDQLAITDLASMLGASRRPVGQPCRPGPARRSRRSEP
jgi:CheY-like chemotaxis protein